MESKILAPFKVQKAYRKDLQKEYYMLFNSKTKIKDVYAECQQGIEDMICIYNICRWNDGGQEVIFNHVLSYVIDIILRPNQWPKLPDPNAVIISYPLDLKLQLRYICANANGAVFFSIGAKPITRSAVKILYLIRRLLENSNANQSKEEKNDWSCFAKWLSGYLPDNMIKYCQPYFADAVLSYEEVEERINYHIKRTLDFRGSTANPRLHRYIEQDSQASSHWETDVYHRRSSHGYDREDFKCTRAYSKWSKSSSFDSMLEQIDDGGGSLQREFIVDTNNAIDSPSSG